MVYIIFRKPFSNTGQAYKKEAFKKGYTIFTIQHLTTLVDPIFSTVWKNPYGALLLYFKKELYI